MRKNTSPESGAFNPRLFLAFILFSIGVSLAIAATGIKLVPGTAVLLSNTSGGGGAGDSYQVVGQLTHKVFFVDLRGPGCVRMSTSTDQRDTWVGENLGCSQSPGAIDDRQWDPVDGSAPLPAGRTGNVYLSFIN